MPYVVTEQKNCFRCTHIGASEAGYICELGFGKAQTIWTGDLALICPLFDERIEREQPADDKDM